MFAEELKGNASRKRQEEAKARRRQLKQQQDKKKQSDATEARSTSTSMSVMATPMNTVPVVSVTEPSVDVVTSTTSKPSAVAAALQQRQLRQEQQRKQKAALTIQCFYRGYRSNCRLLEEQASQLSQRLKDLATLRTLIQQQTAAEYIPPPATATVLVRQLLFVTKSLPCRRRNSSRSYSKLRSTEDVIRLQQVLQCVLLPGILGEDENLDPLLTWTAGEDGHSRLMELLRLCLVSLTSKTVSSSEVLSTVGSFLRTILGGSAGTSARDEIVIQCRIMLPIISSAMMSPIPMDKKKIAVSPYAVTGSSLDLIQILRYHLLFSSGNPIPDDATKRREDCISAKQRAQNDVLFQVTLDAVQTPVAGSDCRRLQTRFVAEILTLPLLTWKVSVASISKLLAIDKLAAARQSLASSAPHVLITMLTSFVEQHAPSLSAGRIASVLATVDAPMTACPATNTQCLLANLVQIGRICPSINGSDASKTDFHAGALFFNVIATLLDVVPLGTFSSRESAVEWISDGKSHHTPIVLSPVVLEQCKLLLVDSFVRNLFNCAIDNDFFGTEGVLRTKNEKDLKHEMNLAEVGTSSAASLAAKEARVERTKSFWQSSKWARKLTSGVSKILSGDISGDTDKKSSSSAGNGTGQLMDTSSIARKLAHEGKGAHDRNVTNAVLASSATMVTDSECKPSAHRRAYNPELFFALSRAYGTILARWGGGGRDDIVKRTVSDDALRFRETEDKKKEATEKADPCTLALLNVLCFSTSIVPTTWALTQSNPNVISDLYCVIDTDRSNIPIRSLVIRPIYSTSIGKSNERDNTGSVILFLFVCCLSHTLIITDDVEIQEMDKPIPIHQIRRSIQLLKKLLYRACCVDDAEDTSIAPDSNYFGLALISSASKTMRDLYDRSSRKPLCIPKLWLVEDLLDKDMRRCKTAGQYEALLSTPVLRICPFLVSFKRRLKLFERIVTQNRVEIQGINDQNPFSPGLKPGIPVRIMRTRLLEDGLATLNSLGSNMRRRIVVHYMNEAGTQESGVDAGGLFKEFWTDLSRLAFDPNYALFRVTEGNCLYPNPSSGAAHGPDHIVLFEFLGRILGKALFEGITIHPQFAHFFLSFLRGDYNYLHMLPDLSTMDVQLYNNLMFLKTYDGDAEDLCLTFTVANDDFGGNNEVPLIPNGAEIAVTNANKQRYIGLMAKHHVCDRVKEQSEAFRRGLWEVIDRSWLRIFNEPELQVLISGSSDGKIDVADMRSHSRYAGGYTAIDRNIIRFWSVVGSFSSKQQADLLRFVTSCERPPPLGFASMNPPFTIQRVGILRDGDKLPSASTCFNTLKLPTYSSEKVLRQRLIYAIEAGAGFELT